MIASPNNSAPQRAQQPEWVDDQLLAETKAVWEPFYGRALTPEEVLGILLAVGRLLDVGEGGKTH